MRVLPPLLGLALFMTCAFSSAAQIAPPPSMQMGAPATPDASTAPSPSLTPSIIIPPGTATSADIVSREVDPAFGAYQRGFYQTAMDDAQKRLAADPNNAASLTLLGQIYEDGVAVPRDLARAADFYRRAVAKGDTNAAFALGTALLQGRGVATDRNEARKMFELAAAKNNAGALYNLGVMKIESESAPDFPAAVSYFRRGADAGSADAAYSLAILYRQGRGVAQDDAQALQWFKRGADDGNIPSMIEYAIMTFNGQGTKADEATAARYFLKAAQKNNPVAQNRAARLLVAGRGLGADIVEGMKWHLLARAAGVGDAWLDGRLSTLTNSQRAAVEDAVRRFNGM